MPAFRRQRTWLEIEILESRVTPSGASVVDSLELCPSDDEGRSSLDSGGKGSAAAKGSAKLPYSYAVTGNAADAGPAFLPQASSGLALMGGGTDVDEVFRWMGTKASGGDFLVLRATGANEYNRYIDGLVPSLDSVATLVIPSRTAAIHSDVATIIRQAEAIFIAGGDQANYVDFWNDTPVEDALYDAIMRNVPVGGTSAGLAVLGDIDFSAVSGTITSSEALANPVDHRIVDGLEGDFVSPTEAAAGTILRYVDDVITESHFMQRDRMGRLLTFMANMDARNLVPDLPRAIAVNEQTALLIEADGLAHVVGNPYAKKLSATEQQRSVYLLHGIPHDPVLMEGVALAYSTSVARANYDPVTRVGDAFDLDELFASPAWSLPELDTYTVLAAGGTVQPGEPGGLIYGRV